MKQKGKFLLFDFNEFSNWLAGLTVHREIKLIQNHHTYLPDYVAFRKLADHFHWLESMEKYQMEQNGFAQIAQNLTTYPDGLIAVGRPFDIIPAGIRGANLTGLCIEHLGNFDLGHDEMTEDHKTTIIKLNAILCKHFGIEINSNDIIFHHWFDMITGERTNGVGDTTLKDGTKVPTVVKSCPGTNFFGGNTVESCQNNFLPQVNNALQTL